MLLEYSGQVVFGADPKVFPEVMNDFVLFSFSMVELKSFDITVLIVSLIAMMALQFLIFKTKIGRAMRASDSNASVASLLV